MKKLLFFLLVLVGLPCLGQKKNPLENIAVEIKSVNPKDTDFSDFQYLKKAIGQHRVVMLGEASHNDGTSMEARSRLVKFLNQEMDFEVLVFETGFYNAWTTNEYLKNVGIDLKEAKAQFMAGGWESYEGSADLFPYARASWESERPLNIAGCDICKARQGATQYLNLLEEVYARYPDLTYNQEDSIRLNHLINATCGFLGNEFLAKVSKEDYEAAYYLIYGYIKHIAVAEKLLQPHQHPSKQELCLFFLRSLLIDLEVGKQIYAGTAWNGLRDKAMADRLKWLLEYIYPDKKIIVWAATGHLMKRAFDFERSYLEYFNLQIPNLQMGDYLSYYNEDTYHIGFTTYSGKRGMIYPKSYAYYKEMSSSRKVQKASKGSLEYYAHQLNKPYLFIDLKNQPSNSWLKKDFPSHIFEVEVTGQWQRMFDAFFFIDEMQPVKKVDKAK